MARNWVATAALLLTFTTTGCGSRSDNSAALTRDLLAYQSQVREDFAAERQRLDARSATVDLEAKQLAGQRHRDPIVAAAIIQSGTLLASMLPLAALVVLLWLALRSERTGELDAADPVELLAIQAYAEEPIRLIPFAKPPGPTLRLADSDKAPKTS